jgi:hypothetical protein
MKMKKAVLLAICIFVMATGSIVGIASAGNTNYSILEYWATVPATIDGKWTSTGEWTDAYIGPLSNNGIFAYKMDTSTGAYQMDFLIEPFFASTNNNPGDIAQVCIDTTNDGGTAPKADDYKIEIVGHTNCTLYQGNGSGWVKTSTNNMVWKDSLTTSPKGNQTHWVIEIQNPDKTGAVLAVGAPPNGLREAYYDAATSKWSDWPPSGNGNSPDTWGVISNYSTEIPEGLSIAFIAVLSTIAVVGTLALRKSNINLLWKK